MSNSIKTNFGYELYWAKTQDYGSKILVFENENNSIPLHFYQKLERTWFVNSGSFIIRWINTENGEIMEGELTEGKVFHIPPLMPVNIIAKTKNSSLTEVNNGIDEKSKILSKS